MLHRILGATLLVFIGVLMALKYRNFSEQNAPHQQNSSYEHLQPLDLEAVQKEVREGDHKLVLINYWASWCVPCLKEFPDILSLREKYGPQGLKVLLISTDDQKNKAAAEKVLMKNKVGFTTYFKGDRSFQVLDQVYPNWNGALPASLIMTRDGEVKEAWFGETSGPQFEARIKKHL